MRFRLFTILITLAASIGREAPAQSIVVRGAVRALDTGEPLLGAVVRAGTDSAERAGAATGAGGAGATWSDSSGQYTLRLAPALRYDLHISRMGYAARDLVILPGGGGGRDSVVRLDVYLAPRATDLARVSVVDRGTPLANEAAAPGSLVLTESDLHQNPALTGAGDADGLRALAMTPAVGALPDAPDPLRVRGGSSDQNLILLDDVPILNPFHAGGVGGGMVAAVNPDVVSSVALHAGVPSARFGNGASSTIELRTPRNSSSRVVARGYADAASVRQMVRGPVGKGMLTLAVRTSTGAAVTSPGGRQDGDGGGSRRGFSDAFAAVSLPLAHGTLETFGLFARSRFGFDARLDNEGSGPASTDAIPGEVTASAETSAPRNAFVWSTQTQAVVWRRRADRPGSRAGVVLRAWRSASTDGAAWASTTAGGGAPLSLTSAFTNRGVGARVVWGGRPGSLRLLAGGDVEQDRSRYEVARSAAVPGAGVASLYALDGALVAAPVFVELRRAWDGDRWTLSTGLRSDVASARWIVPQPRLWIRYRPIRWLGISAGYARTQQREQTLRNEESLVDAVTATGLLSVARAGGVETVRAEQVTGSVDVRLGARTTLLADVYARRMDGLALVAAATAQPFAPVTPPAGSGRASGLTLSLLHRGDRLSLDAGFRSTYSVRTLAGARYRPWFQPSRSLMLAGAYRLGVATWLRLAAWSASGRPATAALGGIEWNAGAAGPLGGGVLPEVAGTPEQYATALGGVSLSSYRRVDAGIRHTWQPARWAPAGLTVDAGVVNVFGRRNALGAFTPFAGGALRPIPMQPRALQLGLGWRF